MSLATVYRNIQLIKSLGEILELGFPDGNNRYDGNRPYPHPHLVCVQCGKILDPDLGSLEHMKEELSRETGSRVLNNRLDFFGVCPDYGDSRLSLIRKRELGFRGEQYTGIFPERSYENTF